MMGRRLLLVVAGLLVARAAVAQPRSWHDLSPAERERAWRKLPAIRVDAAGSRRNLEDRYQRFREMPPNEQQRLRPELRHVPRAPAGEAAAVPQQLQALEAAEPLTIGDRFRGCAPGIGR
jgi:hypothetical protein